MNRYRLLGFVLIMQFVAFSQTHQWTRTNPGGGGVFSTVGASASGIIIAASDLSGAYRSTDGGESWDVIGAANGLTETHVSGIGFHRTNGDIIYLGTENGIFRSDDGGQSFTKVLADGYITDIEFGTNVDSVGYASYHPEYNSNDGVIYKSVDNGFTWWQVSTNLPGGIRILKILVNPQDVNTLYILTGNGRFACGPALVFKSTNGGETWNMITVDFPEILDVALSPVNPNTLYLTTMNAQCNAPYYWTDLIGDLFKSTDGGNSWNYLSDYTGVILLSENDSNFVRLIDPREPYPWNNRSGTFTSTDGGYTFVKTGEVNDWDTFFNHSVYWSYGSSFNGICKTIGEDLSDPSTIYWATSQWVFKSTDGGNYFQNIFTDEVTNGFWKSRGLDNVNMTDVSMSPADPDIIFLAYFDMGIWRSLDGGESWQSCNDSIFTGGWEGHGGNCATILTDPDRSNVVWASQSGYQNGENPTYLIKSTQTGEPGSWFLANAGLPEEQIMGLSVDVNSPINQRVLFVTANKDVYKSTDDGMTWTKVFDCNGCRFTAVDRLNSQIVYAAGEAGVFVSQDGGTSWTDISHPDMISTAGIDFWDPDYQGVFDLQTDPNHTNTVYVVVLGTGKGLYRSTDGGNTWEKLLTDDFLRKVAIVPANSNLIYATSSSAFQSGGYDPNSGGIFFSNDGGVTWTQQNQGMAYPFALAIDIDHTSQPTVFVGSPGTGFQKSPVPVSTKIASSTERPESSPVVFPFPAGNIVWINNINRRIGPLRIFNVLGQEVTSSVSVKQLSPHRFKLDISKLGKGYYFIPYGSETVKFLKR